MGKSLEEPRCLVSSFTMTLSKCWRQSSRRQASTDSTSDAGVTNQSNDIFWRVGDRAFTAVPTLHSVSKSCPGTFPRSSQQTHPEVSVSRLKPLAQTCRNHLLFSKGSVRKEEKTKDGLFMITHAAFLFFFFFPFVKSLEVQFSHKTRCKE